MFSSWAMLVLFWRRHAHAVTATLSACCLAMTGLVAASAPAAASVSSDQTQIAQLQQQISAQGAHVESLVSRYNEVQAQVGAIDAQIATDHALLAADHRAETAASQLLQRIAIDAYVSAGLNSSTLMLFDGSSNITTTFERNDYLGDVNTKWNAALTALRLNQARTQDTGNALRSEQARANATLAQLTSAHNAANAAIASDETTLSRLSSNLRSVLAAANARRQAAQLAAERALASAALTPEEAEPPAPSPSSVSPSPPPVSPPPNSGAPSPSSSGGYANPLRAVTALSPERIDQGVDYSGFGPIYAVGDGVVLSTVNGGWPGGTYIAYQLTDGPAAGLVVYAAEDIEPAVQIGATVTSNTVLGQMYAGPDGIETGWADGSALGDTMARIYQQFSGSNSTAFGSNFSELLESVGAPGGVLQNNPPTGVLPQTWPHW